MKYTCANCSEIHVEEFEGELAVPATGHDYEAVVTAPTCKDCGYTTHTCKNCGDSYVDNETDPIEDAHVYELVRTMKEPTCSTTGIGKYECAVCGNLCYDIIEKAPHTFDEESAEIVTEPTCTEAGVLTVTCSECGETVEEPIEALGHDWGEEQASEDGTYVYRACLLYTSNEIIEISSGAESASAYGREQERNRREDSL